MVENLHYYNRENDIIPGVEIITLDVTRDGNKIPITATIGLESMFIFKKYKIMKERSNPYIDLNYIGFVENIPSLIDTARKYGVEEFVISDKCGDMPKRIWSFIQNGCTLEGMVEINGTYKDITLRERETIQGFLLRIN